MTNRSPPPQNQPSPETRRSLPAIVLGSAAVLGLGVYFAFNSLTAPITSADPDDLVQVSLGEIVYGDYCASCHGQNLEGQPDWRRRKSDGRLPSPPHDETGHTWHHPDKQLFQITKFGYADIAPDYESDMPVFDSILSDEKIWATLSYIKSTWSPEIRQRQDSRSQRTN